MSDAVVTGLKEITDTLKQMPDKLMTNVLQDAVKAGAITVRDAIKEKAPIYTGRLKKSIKVKAVRQRGSKRDTIVFMVKTGVYKKFKKGMRHVNYGKQIEFGNAKIAAKPFIRPVFDSIGQEVLDNTIDKIKFRIAVYDNSRGGQGFQ